VLSFGARKLEATETIDYSTLIPAADHFRCFQPAGVSMPPKSIRPALLLCALLSASLCSCQGGKRFYSVHGRVSVDGKPAEGVTVVFHPLEQTDPPLQPYAVVGSDGSYKLLSWLVEERELKEGAPAGEYKITCVWYPADLGKYGGVGELPDRLGGKYSDKDKSGLTATVAEAPTEVPPIELHLGTK
jgi:hypothetical protein